MERYPKTIEKRMLRHFQSLNEKHRRNYAAIEALKLGHGGITYICKLFGLGYHALRRGIKDLNRSTNSRRIRNRGGGRKRIIDTLPHIDEVFLAVLDGRTAGDPMRGIRWTNLSRPKIAERMAASGVFVSVFVIRQLMKKHKISRRKLQKKLQ